VYNPVNVAVPQFAGITDRVVNIADAVALIDAKAALVQKMRGGKHGKDADMAAIQRQFYRSSRGPGPSDEDSWYLVFEPDTRRLLVRHEWQASGHSGFDELPVAEFLQQTGGAQTAFIDSLFRVPADAQGL
jgi:hypothetical protein